MCGRRIVLCSFCLLLLLCCSTGVAMAAEAPAGDEPVTAETFLQDLGFDTEDEESVDAFLNWLYPLAPSSADDMGLILSGSAYAGLDADKVFLLWSALHDAVEPLAGQFYYGYLGMNPTEGVIYVTSAANGGTIKAQLDLKSFMAQQGYLTAASLTTVETKLGQIYDFLNNSLHVQLGTIHTDIINIDTGLSNIHSLLGFIYDRFDLFESKRNWSYNASTNKIESATGTIPVRGVAELLNMNFKDLDQLLLKNFGTAKVFSYYEPRSGDGGYISPAGASLMEVLSNIGSTLYHGFGAYGWVLLQNGERRNLSMSEAMPLGRLTASSFLGLNHNLEVALVGGHGGKAEYSRLTFDDQLNKSSEPVSYTDLLSAMVGIGTDIQNPLSQLQAVLAGDSDLELHRQTQENIDQVTEDFTGDGAGAVSPGNIDDASGLTSGVGEAFGGNQVSTGDAFQTMSDSGNYNFFSQETAIALDSVSYPAAAVLSDDVDAEDADSYLDGFTLGEDGFYTVSDASGWNILDYLGKEG